MDLKHLKTILERVGFTSALTLLVAYFALTGAAFLIAAHDQRIPATWWESSGGNHGPWRHYYPGRALLNYALLVLLSAMLMGGISSFLGRTRGGSVMLISLGLFILDFVFLFWLVD